MGGKNTDVMVLEQQLEQGFVSEILGIEYSALFVSLSHQHFLDLQKQPGFLAQQFDNLLRRKRNLLFRCLLCPRLQGHRVPVITLVLSLGRDSAASNQTH